MTLMAERRSKLRGARSGARIGRVIAVDGRGRLIVDWPGNRRGPRPARIGTQGDSAFWRAAAAAGADVLLLLARGGVPVVAGPVRDSADQLTPATVAPETRTILASRELTLRCGKASVTLTSDGRVTVQGVDVVSRAARTNKIKGGSVQIN